MIDRAALKAAVLAVAPDATVTVFAEGDFRVIVQQDQRLVINGYPIGLGRTDMDIRGVTSARDRAVLRCVLTYLDGMEGVTG